MPIITRSNTTGPVKTVIGVKRKFIEIMDSDSEYMSDDSSTEISDSESEFEPDIADVLEDEIEDLKDDLKETEQSNDALINLLIKEREANQTIREDSDQVINALHKELDETKEKYEKLLNNVKDVQKTSWIEFICFTGMLAITTGSTLSALYRCYRSEYWY